MVAMLDYKVVDELGLLRSVRQGLRGDQAGEFLEVIIFLFILHLLYDLNMKLK